MQVSGWLSELEDLDAPPNAQAQMIESESYCTKILILPTI